jgi:hypothetical protein
MLDWGQSPNWREHSDRELLADLATACLRLLRRSVDRVASGFSVIFSGRPFDNAPPRTRLLVAPSQHCRVTRALRANPTYENPVQRYWRLLEKNTGFRPFYMASGDHVNACRVLTLTAYFPTSFGTAIVEPDFKTMV